MKIYPILPALCAATALLGGAACTRDEVGGTLPSEERGAVRLELTDAPIDDRTVEAVFITVAEVHIDGKIQSDLSVRKTIDISSYQNGRTIRIGGQQSISADVHGNLELVLDLATDADGNSPGCYVLRRDGTKDALAYDGSQTVSVNTSTAFTVGEGSVTRLVADFNLRKAVKRAGPRGEDFTFGSEANLTASTRLADVRLSGNVSGEVRNYSCGMGYASDGGSDDGGDWYDGYQRYQYKHRKATKKANKGKRKNDWGWGDHRGSTAQSSDGEPEDGATCDGLVVAYLYSRGQYNATAAAGNEFAGAASSSRVDAEGRFNLAFVPAGKYDLVLAEYTRDEEGQAHYQGMLLTDPVLGSEKREVLISGSASVDLVVDLQLD